MAIFDIVVIIAIIYAVSQALPSNCTHGDVRVNSASNSNDLEGVSGRLEICFDNVWFVICPGYPWKYYQHFTNEKVVCQKLGYTTSGTEKSAVFFYSRPLQ